METKTPPKYPVIAAGAVALLVGIGLLLWGLAPAKGFGPAMEVFGGGTPPDDLGEQIDATMTNLGKRVWADGVGFVLILGGIIAMSAGKPQDRPTEELVEQAIKERLGDGHASGNQAGAPVAEGGAPTDAVELAPSDPGPASPQPAGNAALPAPAPAAASVPTRRTPPARVAAVTGQGACPKCGKGLIAGGRFCPACGPVK